MPCITEIVEKVNIWPVRCILGVGVASTTEGYMSQLKSRKTENTKRRKFQPPSAKRVKKKEKKRTRNDSKSRVEQQQDNRQGKRKKTEEKRYSIREEREDTRDIYDSEYSREQIQQVEYPRRMS